MTEIRPADMREMQGFQLCYVEDTMAFFTTQELSKQWGDDWNDAPYEHNAGYPYEHHASCDKDKPYWSVLKLHFEANLDQPCEGHNNSTFTVEDINSGVIAWLRSSKYTNLEYMKDKKVIIHAGCNVYDFVTEVERSGGVVYVPKDRIVLFNEYMKEQEKIHNE